MVAYHELYAQKASKPEGGEILHRFVVYSDLIIHSGSFSFSKIVEHLIETVVGEILLCIFHSVVINSLT